MSLVPIFYGLTAAPPGLAGKDANKGKFLLLGKANPFKKWKRPAQWVISNF
jgi:hypothetical protein